jgi:hypothetical protein
LDDLAHIQDPLVAKLTYFTGICAVGLSKAGLQAAVLMEIGRMEMTVKHTAWGTGPSAALLGAALVTLSFARSAADDSQPAGRYLPEYNSARELLMSKNFRECAHVGSPLTPNAVNGW